MMVVVPSTWRSALYEGQWLVFVGQPLPCLSLHLELPLLLPLPLPLLLPLPFCLSKLRMAARASRSNTCIWRGN